MVLKFDNGSNHIYNDGVKTCRDCKEEKELSEFNKKGNGFQSRCRGCQKIWYKDYYENSGKEKDRLARNRTAKAKLIRETIRKLKQDPCMDCGESYPPYVMDFDHRDGSEKEFNVGNMTRSSVQKVLDEIAKCDLVCANCHRERTYRRRIPEWVAGNPD